MCVCVLLSVCLCVHELLSVLFSFVCAFEYVCAFCVWGIRVCDLKCMCGTVGV